MPPLLLTIIVSGFYAILCNDKSNHNMIELDKVKSRHQRPLSSKIILLPFSAAQKNVLYKILGKSYPLGAAGLFPPGKHLHLLIFCGREKQ